MKRLLKAILSGALCTLLLAGCAAAEPRASGTPVSSQETEDPFLVMASFHPMLLLTRMVTDGVEGVEVQCMAEANTGCLHDYQLLPGDLRNLQEADLFIINGLGMESFIQQLLDQLPDLAVTDTSAGFAAELDAEASSEHAGHTHQVNGHVWLSVPYAMQQVQAICDALCAGDPVHAQAYQDNTQRALERMQALHEDLEAQLAPLADTAVVSFHDAFDWYHMTYGLNIVQTLSLHEEEPSTRQITELVERIQAEDVAALLVEPYTQEPPAVASMVERETGCPIIVLDPLTRGEEDPEAYFTAMKENVQTLVEALS